MDELTPRQGQILAFIRAYIEREGCPPTLREIGDAMGIKSTHGVDDAVRALERKGCVEVRRRVARGIRVLQGGKSAPPGPQSK